MTSNPPSTEWGPELHRRYSDLLLRLYQMGSSLPEEEFQEQAFEAVKKLIPFDGGWWALGVSEALPDKPYAGPKIFDVHFYKISPKMLKLYNQFAHLDTFSQALARKPGVTRNICTREWYSMFFWPYLDFFKLQQVMSTNVVQAQTGLTTGITFVRHDRTRPFSEIERQIKQSLMPHLIEAFSRNQIEPWARDTLPAQHYPLAAVVDGEGQLRHAADGFAAMLLREWPDWRGPVLPEPLRDILVSGNGGQFSGAQIFASVDQREHLALVQVRSISMLDQLSERQMKIARYAVDGLSHKEIGRLMELSPITVRNYLTNVYTKLGVSNKLQLAELLRNSK